MGHPYQAVQWTRKKLIYDGILLALVMGYLVVFTQVTYALNRAVGSVAEWQGVEIRAYGSAAFILLSIILCIGPLSRLNKRFHVLLFNRRHMGVLAFLLALFHVHGFRFPSQPFAALGLTVPRLPFQFFGALPWYNDFGDIDPIVSLFVGNRHFDSVTFFPFELLGLGALLVMFVMAATSHDFWLVNLTPPIWKGIHMAVYVAYALLIGHILLGPLQTNRDPWLTALALVSFVCVIGLHLISGWRERKADRPLASNSEPLAIEGYVDVMALEDLDDGFGTPVVIRGERVALFRQGDAVYALSNVCAHQNGPLADGRLSHGCVVCPWHGWEYRIETGVSPPPFEERVPVFPVRIQEGRVYVALQPVLNAVS